MSKSLSRLVVAIIATAAVLWVVPSLALARQHDGSTADGMSDADVERIEQDCLDQGGDLDIYIDEGGGEYMHCLFPDGTDVWCFKLAGRTTWRCEQKQPPGMPAPDPTETGIDPLTEIDPTEPAGPSVPNRAPSGAPVEADPGEPTDPGTVDTGELESEAPQAPQSGPSEPASPSVPSQVASDPPVELDPTEPANPGTVDTSHLETETPQAPELDPTEPANPGADLETETPQAPELDPTEPADPGADLETETPQAPELDPTEPADPGADLETETPQAPELDPTEPADPGADLETETPQAPQTGPSEPSGPTTNPLFTQVTMGSFTLGS